MGQALFTSRSIQPSPHHSSNSNDKIVNLSEHEVSRQDLGNPRWSLNKTIEIYIHQTFGFREKRKLFHALLTQSEGGIELAKTLAFVKLEHEAHVLDCEFNKKYRDIYDIRRGASFVTPTSSEEQRKRVYQDFENGELKLLVAVDLTCEGLEVSDLTRVVQFEAPCGPPERQLRMFIERCNHVADGGEVHVFVDPDSYHDCTFAPTLIAMMEERGIGDRIQSWLRKLANSPMKKSSKPMKRAIEDAESFQFASALKKLFNIESPDDQ